MVSTSRYSSGDGDRSFKGVGPVGIENFAGGEGLCSSIYLLLTSGVQEEVLDRSRPTR